MSVHDGRTQKMSGAANRAFYFEDIYCSVSPVTHPLSRYFLNCLLSLLSLLSQISLSQVYSWWQNQRKDLSREKNILEPRIEHSYMMTSTAVSHLSPNIFLNPFSTVSSLYCLSSLKFHSLMSIHDGRTQERTWAAKRTFFYDEID
jgi:hypothetical protein